MKNSQLTKIKKTLFCTFCICISQFSIGQTIANCSNPEGWTYYHFNGMVSKKDSGFTKDKVTGGMTTIEKLSNGKYDILTVDARRKVTSMKQEGGDIVLLRKGATDATFLLYFPNNTIEIYTIWIDKNGIGKYDWLQSKGGDDALLHKSVLFVGSCENINLDILK
jgi:hypothetical protein